MKIVSVVGARPQFIKAAAVSRVLRTRHTEVLVHTGQHYDANMSAVFFDELGIPVPEIQLHVGSGTHGAQTGAMLAQIEAVLLQERPDWILVYGDTNSTLAGALAASKIHIPIAHVEAGLRSFNRAMPEEINRVMVDHLSTVLLCPSHTAVEQLAAEGICRGVHMVGDVMFDALLFARAQASTTSHILSQLGVEARSYLLATVHRAENTDDPNRLHHILRGFEALETLVLFPVHPRTRKALAALNYTLSPRIRLLDAVGYLDMVMLEESAQMIMTDSGGVQKEAYWLGVPCITLRDETEWVETVEAGWNVLVGTDETRIVDAARAFVRPDSRRPLYGDGRAAERCIEVLEQAGTELPQ